MIIKEIELNDFRIYYGKNVINLMPEDNKNIIIVSGENGFGKTTFLMSLVWCLYGKQMGKVDELYNAEITGKGTYSNYIANSLNHKAYEEHKRTFSVSITFTDVDIPGVECNEIKITRSYNVENSSGDDLSILFDGKENEDIFPVVPKEERIKDAELFIREQIMPIEIAKFYLFDAEKIVAYASIDTTEQRDKLSQAYSQVLGIQKFEDLKNELEFIRDEYKKESANPQDRTELIRLEAVIESDIESLNAKRKEQESIQEQINELESEITIIQERLIREGDTMTAEQLSNLKNQMEVHKEMMQEAQNGLKELYNFIPFALSGSLFSSLIEQVKKEKTYKQIKVQQESVENKMDGLLSDLDNASFEAEFPIDRKIKRFYEDELKKLIKKHFYEELDSDEFTDFSPLHEFTEIQENTLMSFVSKVKASRSDFKNLYEKYNSAKREFQSIESKIREAERKAESSLTQDLRKKKDTKAEEKGKFYASIAAIDFECGRLAEEVKTSRQQKEILLKKVKVSELNKPKEDELESLIKKLAEFLKRFKAEKAMSLQTKIENKMKSFLHKENLIGGVEVFIHGDTIDISLLDLNNKKIDINTLSMGERQMFSSALLGSLVEETEIEFPVFIDSPMQKFDVNHTENILKKFYPYVSKQVVLFPLLKKELTETEYDMIIDRVNQTYLIKNNDKGSEFSKIDKNDLFK